MKVRWLNGALRSLRAVHAYIALDDPQAARRATARIEAAVARLAEFPELGRAGTVAGTRELIVSGVPYVVVYRVAESGVIILRVFHARQNQIKETSSDA